MTFAAPLLAPPGHLLLQPLLEPQRHHHVAILVPFAAADRQLPTLRIEVFHAYPAGQTRGQAPFAGTAWRVLRTKGGCPFIARASAPPAPRGLARRGGRRGPARPARPGSRASSAFAGQPGPAVAATFPA